MRYKTKDIGDEGLDICVAVTEAWLRAECPDVDVRPSGEGIVFSGRLEPAGDEYLLRGAIRGGLVTQCVRCLESATLALDVPVTLTFVESEEPTGKEEDEDDEEDVITFQDGTIDVGSEIRDELLLALPMGPLCREDCAGICPTCGVNRNLTPCDCAERPKGGGKFAARAKVRV
ncbi:MAG TPA: DUF177 domain-containing protein [Polyangia bacterium]|jgi:uncharacterized protein|nr:DUF177 domain-containing protein [Polyangia bacterium]